MYHNLIVQGRQNKRAQVTANIASYSARLLADQSEVDSEDLSDNQDADESMERTTLEAIERPSSSRTSMLLHTRPFTLDELLVEVEDEEAKLQADVAVLETEVDQLKDRLTECVGG